MSEALDIVMAALADRHGPGQHSGLACPECQSRTTDRALSLKVDVLGNIRYVQAHCHRASCGFSYSNGHLYQGLNPSVLEVSESRVRPYPNAISVLSPVSSTWLEQRFLIGTVGIRQTQEFRYLLPICRPDGSRRGWISRAPWEDSPLEVTLRARGIHSSPKALTFMDVDEPVQSWYRSNSVFNIPQGTVLVEDQISAMRVTSDTNHDAVAILGTGLNEGKVAEIQRHAKHILIALDSDATGQAFAMARKWGQAFESCRVVILERDIKDSSVETVQSLFR